MNVVGATAVGSVATEVLTNNPDEKKTKNSDERGKFSSLRNQRMYDVTDF